MYRHAQAAIIGMGNIGAPLLKRVSIDLNFDVGFTGKSNGFFTSKEGLRGKLLSPGIDNFKSLLTFTDIVFLAIPSDRADVAKDYIKTSIDNNVPIVICEKGALSEHFEELAPYLTQMGYNASVGGETRMLAHAKHAVDKHASGLYFVNNGTLNYVFDPSILKEFGGVEKAVAEAQRLGMAEPGKGTPADILNGELGDIVKKVVITANVLGITGKDYLNAKNIEAKPLDDYAIEQILKDKMRYVVSLTRFEPEKGDTIGGFRISLPEWQVNAGFQPLTEKEKNLFIPPKEFNRFTVLDGIGYNKVDTGRGAGPEPTTRAMIDDAQRLLVLPRTLYDKPI